MDWAPLMVNAIRKVDLFWEIMEYEDIEVGSGQNRWKGKNGNSVARENGWTGKEEVKGNSCHEMKIQLLGAKN